LVKKAEKKEGKAVKEKESHKAVEKEEKKGHKDEEKHSHKDEEKPAHKEEKHHEAEKHEKKAEAHRGHGETAPVVKAEKHTHKEEQKEEEEIDDIQGVPEAGVQREHGKSRKPKKGKQPKRDFVELKPAEITEAIVHLANEGHSASEIGMILRDQYGVPMVGKAMGKKLCAILREHGLFPPVPDDMMSLIRKSVTLGEHLAKNKKDMSAKRGLMLTVSKIRALEKYYKKKGVLPMGWRYSAETASLLAK